MRHVILAIGLALALGLGLSALAQAGEKGDRKKCENEADRLIEQGLKWNDPLAPKQAYLGQEPLKITWTQVFVACLQEKGDKK